VSDPTDDGVDRRTDLAGRRTSLANERTLLAWWRTGLTALAVALGVGRLLPELAPDATRWPFVAIGVAFAVYGIALFLYGTRRSGERDESLLGGPATSPDRALTMLSAAGVVLGVASAVLILTQ
jgi:putative membrane protein